MKCELFERPAASSQVEGKKLQKLGRAFLRCSSVDNFDEYFFDYFDEFIMQTLEEVIWMFDKQNKEWGLYKK